MSDADADESGSGSAVVLDYLAHGRSDDDRPRYQKRALVYTVDAETFRLEEAILAEDVDVGIDDRISLAPEDGLVETHHPVSYDELSGGARSELDYVIEDLIDEDPDRFVDFFNEAQPITLRLHQLDLLPGIGEKLRNAILDERKRGPFEDFEDLEARVDGLHSPRDIVVDRIVEELTEEDLKYRNFVDIG